MSRPLTRREFLQLCALTGGAAVLNACQRRIPTAVPEPVPTTTPVPTATVLPSSTPSPQPSISPTPDDPRTKVAVRRVNEYDPKLLRASLEQMFTDLGGLDKVVRPGARVGIKPNLTGGTWWDGNYSQPATELFVTHPAVVAVLAELLRDAGASEIYFMDGLGDETIFDVWGYTEAAKPTSAKLIDLCKPDPEPDFQAMTTGPNGKVFESFHLHPILGELDTFISVAKMKVHSVGGVTLGLKNLFGIAPISVYRRSESENNRSLFHEGTEWDPRLANIIVDLNLARPVHLTIIDGINTVEGGAGPWDTNLRSITPGMLVAGFDTVAADAVGTMLMGFNPEAVGGETPFLHSDNHLALANAAGLGTHHPEAIRVMGTAVEEGRLFFQMP